MTFYFTLTLHLQTVSHLPVADLHKKIPGVRSMDQILCNFTFLGEIWSPLPMWVGTLCTGILDPPLSSLSASFTSILLQSLCAATYFHFAHVTTISLVSSVALRAPRKVKRPMVICPTYVLHTKCSNSFDACV